MEDNWPPRKRATFLRKKFARLSEKRRKMMALARAKGRTERKRLTTKQRKRVLAKTKSRCHICGGKVGAVWQADHRVENTHANDISAFELPDKRHGFSSPVRSGLIIPVID